MIDEEKNIKKINDHLNDMTISTVREECYKTNLIVVHVMAQGLLKDVERLMEEWQAHEDKKSG